MSRRPYIWSARISVVFTVLLMIATIGGFVFLKVHDRTAEIVCGTTTRTYELDDGYQ